MSAPSPRVGHVKTRADVTRPLRVVIDARLVPGEWGGVEGVVIGLASGLTSLEDVPEEYLFVVWEGLDSWLRPYVSGGTRLLMAPRPSTPAPRSSTLRRRMADRFPIAAAVWRARPGRSIPGPPHGDAFIDALEPDVIHQPLQPTFITLKPSIYHPHDLQHVHLPRNFASDERRRRELWYGTLCRAASMVAVASTWTKHDVQRHYELSPDRVRVVPLAPPLAAFRDGDGPSAETISRFALPDRFILYPAQTWPHKNHAALLRAIAQLRDRDELVVNLVAPGHRTDYFPELERHARELGVHGQVWWLGFVTESELHALYARAVAVVIPSRFEAASAPLWEAFLAGTPAACSTVTSLPAQAGDAALLFDPDDVPKIAESIRRLWTDTELRERLVRAGRSRLAPFSWDRTARIFRAHYRRLGQRRLTDEDRELLDATPPL